MNYYKITNEKEKHNNLQYKTGLNKDILPFNPSGNCEPGGIYFSREDILEFLDYGPWIRKVTIPDDAQIYENPGKPKKWKADKIILGKRRKIDAKVIEELIKEGVKLNSDAIYWASANDEKGNFIHNPSRVPIKNWVNSSNHDSCWKSDGLNFLTNEYFNFCKKINPNVAPKDVDTRSSFDLIPIRYIKITYKNNDNYSNKIVKVEEL